MSLKHDVSILKSPRRDWSPHEDDIDEIEEVVPMEDTFQINSASNLYYIFLNRPCGYMHPNGKFYTRNFGFWDSKSAAEEALAIYLKPPLEEEIFI